MIRLTVHCRHGVLKQVFSMVPLGGAVCTVSAGKPRAVNWSWWVLQEEDGMGTRLGWDFTFTGISSADALRLGQSCLAEHKRIMRPQRSLCLLGTAGGELGLAECNR